MRLALGEEKTTLPWGNLLAISSPEPGVLPDPVSVLTAIVEGWTPDIGLIGVEAEMPGCVVFVVDAEGAVIVEEAIVDGIGLCCCCGWTCCC